MSARAAGINRRTHARWMEQEAYAAAFHDAQEEAIDGLADEARRRALEGVEKPIFHRGKQVGSVRQYSDTLLIFLLKALKPEVYGDRHNSSKNAMPIVTLYLPGNGRDAE